MSSANSSNSKLGDYFLRLPKLNADGSNWVIYKDRFIFAAEAAGLEDYIPESSKPPTKPSVADPNAGPTSSEKTAIEAWEKQMKTWNSESAILKQGIASTIPDSLFLKVKGEKTVGAMWKKLVDEHQGKSRMMVVDLRRKLQNERCESDEDVRDYITRVITIREDLVSMNADPGDDNFVAIIMSALPPSYDPYLAALTATATLVNQQLSVDTYIRGILDESDRRKLGNRNSKSGAKEAAYNAGPSKKFGNKKSVKCYNCGKTGHMKKDCFAEGGGKAGQWPKHWKGKGKSTQANTATTNNEDFAWYAHALSDDVWELKVQENISGYQEPKNEIDEQLEGLGAIYVNDEFLWDSNNESNRSSVQSIKEFELPHDSDSDDGNSMPDLQSVSTSLDAPDNWRTEEIWDDEAWFSDIDELEVPDLQEVEDSDNEEGPLETSSNGPILVELSIPDPDAIQGQQLQDIDYEEINVDDFGKAYTRYNSIFLANADKIPDGVTELYDSGASRHMSPYRDKFINFTSIAPKSIRSADSGTFDAIGRGDMHVTIPGKKKTTTVLIKDVLYAPKLSVTLISISRITAAGCSIMFRDNFCRIYGKGDKVLGQINSTNGLYQVTYKPDNVYGMAARPEKVTVNELHRRLGHIAPEACRKMVKDGLIEGIELDESEPVKSCDTCEYAKKTRKPINKERELDRAAKIGDLVHSDVWGPAPVQTPSHKRYYCTFTDDHSRWSTAYILATKDETYDAFKQFCAWFWTQKEIRIKVLGSDRGGEYLSNLFSQYLAEEGIQRNLTVHDTPEHNGVSERLNRTLLERIRAMLYASGLPKNLWGEALKHAIWLKNRSGTKALGNTTPYEVMFGEKPNLSNIREWGAKVWVHNDRDSKSKLDARARIGHWLGFDLVSSGHRIYWPETKTISVERSIKFDKDAPTFVPGGIRHEEEDEGFMPNPIELETLQIPNPVPTPTKPSVAPTGPITPTIPKPVLPRNNHLGTLNSELSHQNIIEGSRRRTTTRKVQDLLTGEGHTDSRPSAPLVTPGIQLPTTIPENEPGEQAQDIQIEFGLAAAAIEAKGLEPSYEEAKTRVDWPKWKEARDTELKTLLDAGTWEILPRPDNQNVVDCKWALKIKMKNGLVDKYKARLVAKGFTQVEGVDFFETFAPVAKLASLRSILAIAARNDWDIEVFDFHGAFLNATFEDNEEIFMEQPPDIELADRNKYVLKLKKTLYGLRQSSRKWYEMLTSSLGKLGFSPLEKDHAVFKKIIGDNIIILAIHVDDVTITGSSPTLIQETKVEISKEYEVTFLGPIDWLLGMKVTRDRANRTISLSQEAFIESALKEMNMADCKPLAMPMDPNVHLSKDQCPTDPIKIAEMAHLPFRKGTGKINWVSIGTRPDLSYAVSDISQCLGNPGHVHWEALKRLFRYLQGTKHWKLVFGGPDRKHGLEGYSDADGMSHETRRAVSGYAFLLDGGAISWSSKKQELVTLSTTEAEYVALTHAAKEAQWLRQFLEELFGPINEPFTLYGDNQSAIALAHSQAGQFHARTKHIDIRYHFIRYCIENGSIQLLYCPTEDMVADALTKALPSSKAKHFAMSLGLSPA